MRNKNKSLFLTVGLLAFIYCTSVSATETISTTDTAKKFTASINNYERRQYMAILQDEYEKTKQILLQNLYDTKKKNINNNVCFSPLHAAILTVEAWHIIESDNTLLEIIDYAIDPLSIPDGMHVSGDFFYPPIRVLVKLRVDVDKVIEAIINAKNSRQIALLTWVLNERQGQDVTKSVSLLMNAINKYDKPTEKNNLLQAINLLKNIKDSSDLIPSPLKTTKHAR